jgi:hypothetical protein
MTTKIIEWRYWMLIDYDSKNDEYTYNTAEDLTKHKIKSSELLKIWQLGQMVVPELK